MIEKSITLGHGSGGRLTYELIESLFLKRFSNPILDQLTDAAVLNTDSSPWAFTTDSYVVKPPFFPGGDIGKLAICGTVNDLSVMGARPLFIASSFIIEEGFSLADLEKVADSMKAEANAVPVSIVTGDVKVVERRGGGDIFITTSGLGLIERPGLSLNPQSIEVGDKLIINGTIGEHGLAIFCFREGLQTQPQPLSDCACLYSLIQEALKASPRIRFMRDPTRGGLASTLNEVAHQRGLGFVIEEESVPVKEEVRSLGHLLGLDPLYLANEGKVLMVCPQEEAEKVLEAMRVHPLGRESHIIGHAVEKPAGKVLINTAIGGQRILPWPLTDPLPRIC